MVYKADLLPHGVITSSRQTGMCAQIFPSGSVGWNIVGLMPSRVVLQSASSARVAYSVEHGT
eukprot:scaffold234931_cov20-Tisochrysis_lutea.AAC.1